MNEYVIRRVKNGFVVMPPRDYSTDRGSMSSADVFVFETFAKAAEWLALQFAE